MIVKSMVTSFVRSVRFRFKIRCNLNIPIVPVCAGFGILYISFCWIQAWML